jgi:hypothetical protein
MQQHLSDSKHVLMSFIKKKKGTREKEGKARLESYKPDIQFNALTRNQISKRTHISTCEKKKKQALSQSAAAAA